MENGIGRSTVGTDSEITGATRGDSIMERLRELVMGR